MHYKITIFGACAPYARYELHLLSRMERKMTCHQNPGPGYHIAFLFYWIVNVWGFQVNLYAEHKRHVTIHVRNIATGGKRRKINLQYQSVS